MNVSQSYRDGALLRRQFWQRLLCLRHSGLVAGKRNQGSLQSGLGLIVNQILPRSKIGGLLGQRPATTAISQSRVNGTAAHLPGGVVQQGCKCHGSLRVVKTGHIFGQRNIYACALGNPHRFHFGHAIGMANLANLATREKILTLLKWLERSNAVRQLDRKKRTLLELRFHSA